MGVQFDSRAKGKKFHGYYWDRSEKKKVSVGMYMTREEAEEAVSTAVTALNLRLEEIDLITLENKKKHQDKYAAELDRKKFNQPTFDSKPKRGVFPLISLQKFEDSLKPEQKPPPDLKFGMWKKETKEEQKSEA